MFTHSENEIETVILIDAPGAGLDVKGREARNALVLELHAADMERIAGILAPKVGARIRICCKFEFETAAYEPAHHSCGGRNLRFHREGSFRWQR